MISTLERLLSSKVKAAVLHLLFLEEGRELHVREMARRAGLSEGTVRQELARLADLGVVAARRSGNRMYYRADPTHVLHGELRGLVLKTSGVAGVLREALAGPETQVAFIFGSTAAGTDRAGSDVDLMVIGSLSLRGLASKLSDVTERLGREVNPHVMSSKEWAERRRRGDHFLSTVMSAPRTFVKGDDVDLEAMG